MPNATAVTPTFKLGGELEVNRLGYGAMRLTGEGIWGEPKDRESAKKVLKRAVELGVNFIDTADSYGPAVSEPLIGEALAPYTGGVVIATKGGLTRQGPNRWLPVGRPEYLTQQVELSLRFLKLETQPGGKLDQSAKQHGATVSQLSLAWLLHRSPVMLPIPGTSSVEHLEENMKAAELTLSDSEWQELEAAAK